MNWISFSISQCKGMPLGLLKNVRKYPQVWGRERAEPRWGIQGDLLAVRIAQKATGDYFFSLPVYIFTLEIDKKSKKKILFNLKSRNSYESRKSGIPECIITQHHQLWNDIML